MDSTVGDPQQWAATQFGAADCGDRRRTQRLVTLAAQIAANPAGSLPDQAQTWGDLKAAYRLLDRPEVTFAAVATPHWQQTRAAAPTGERVLVLNDTTEIDFARGRHITGLGPVGNGGRQGFLLHSGLMAAGDAVFGLAGQLLHYRQPARPGETRTQRLRRHRESDLWGELIDQVGPPPPGATWVHVMDRGADHFEVLCHCQAQRADWVVRAKSLHRKMRTPDGQEVAVHDYLRTLPRAGEYQLKLRARPGQAARAARLEVRYGPLTLGCSRSSGSCTPRCPSRVGPRPRTWSATTRSAG